MSISRRRKKCRGCGELFLPCAQTYREQITCDKEPCQTWRRRRAQKNWRIKNIGVVDPLIWEDHRRWWDETWWIVLSRVYPNQERSADPLMGRPQEPQARVEKHDA